MITKTLAPRNGVEVFTIMRIGPGKTHHGTLSNTHHDSRGCATSGHATHADARPAAPARQRRLTAHLNRQFRASGPPGRGVPVLRDREAQVPA
jgi:hypothetical protein